MQTLTIAENSNADLRKKLTAEEQARKSADVALKGAEKQAKSQRKLTNEAKEKLAASKEQVAALKQQLEEAKKLKDQAKKAKMQAEEDKAKVEKERDEAEQHGYNVGVAETEDTLRAEVPTVCRAYCTQTWEEALNQHPPSTGQQGQGREQEILKESSSDKVTKAFQPGVASQDFEK